MHYIVYWLRTMFQVDLTEDKIKMVPIYLHDKCSWSYCANYQ